MSEGLPREPVSLETAVAMLPDGDTIHTFRSGPGLLLGADMSRAQIVEAMKAHGVELSGHTATSMCHGLALRDEHGWLFIATRDAGDVR